MIAFATFFLGLVFGVVNVELDVAHEVRSAKLLLDGTEVATLEAPWRARVDLGPALSPHELVAVALDANGREVGRSRQWINRPRAAAEAAFVLEPGRGGTGRIARLSWMCSVEEAPPSTRAPDRASSLRRRPSRSGSTVRGSSGSSGPSFRTTSS